MRIIILAVFLLLSVPLSGAQWPYINTLPAIAVTNTAAGVFCTIGTFACDDVRAAAGHPQASLATCSLTLANIRVTYDGTTPTTSFGEVLTPGVYTIVGTDVLIAMQAIRDDATNAELNCSLWGGQ